MYIKIFVWEMHFYSQIQSGSEYILKCRIRVPVHFPDDTIRIPSRSDRTTSYLRIICRVLVGWGGSVAFPPTLTLAWWWRRKPWPALLAAGIGISVAHASWLATGWLKGKNVVFSCNLIRLPSKITHQQYLESSVADPWHFDADPDPHIWLMDLDPTPDPTPFFNYIKDAKNFFSWFFLIT